MRPVKVTAHMASAICNHVPMLDGVLSAMMGIHMSSVRNTRHGHRHTGPDCNGHENIPIPIASAMIGGWRVPRASSPIYRVEGEDVAHITRVAEFDEDAIRPGMNKINVTGGSFKGMRLPKRVIVTQRVVWFAMAKADGAKVSGHVSRLRSRLKRINAIGAKWDVGFGRVAKWEVEPVEEDHSWFAPTDDGPALMRPLPVCSELPDNLIGFKRWFDRPAPPYHAKASACEVVVPC